MSIEVELKHVEKHYGTFYASRDVSFAAGKGRLIGLLGPSGSGKTTILRMIAGLEQPDSGDIYIGGRRVNELPPGQRGIGFVFQNYALFRHSTVRDNVGFGLEVQGMPRTRIKKKVDELLELVGLQDFAQRYPMQLSGGQRQRVAFARALAPEPELLLLDEPFAAIDAKVRKELRGWLRRAIHQLGITSLFVTHDQEEAVEVADDIIIVHQGHIEQAGTPVEIYQQPHTPFVAKFIGESVHVADYTIFKGFPAPEQETDQSHEAILRPEFLELGADRSEMRLPLGSEKGIVRGVYFRGDSAEVDVEVKGVLLKCRRSLEKRPLHEGDEAYVFIHRICSFAGGRAVVRENAAKQPNSVII